MPRTPLMLLMAALPALPAAAQQLWNIEEVTGQPVPPAVMDGVAVSAAAAGAEAATVMVEYDYLRLGMGYLELPLPDGSMIEAENAVFEDRGNGNFLWSGEVPGAGYESVLFTVQDGHLVGWFGAPGGPKYVVHAGPDGRGTLAVEVGPTGDWCGVGAEPRDELEEVRDAARGTPDRPVPVASEANDNRLDILLLYTSGTERYWRLIGGTAVGVQKHSDYLNMVFRNGAIPATANLIPVRWDPEHANHPWTRGGHFEDQRYVGFSDWNREFIQSAEVARLRERWAPDLIHFVQEVGPGGAGTQRSSLDPKVHFGRSVPSVGIFAHEIGHNLGGHHEPVTFGDRFPEVQADSFRPYVFGHTDLTSCSQREGFLRCPATIMSYGADLDDDPSRSSIREPFYSSVRHKPNGWTIGIAGEREVERVFHETVPVAVRNDEARYVAEQHPKRIDARWTGRDSVRVTWTEGFRYYGGVSMMLALAEGANDSYTDADDNWTILWRDGINVGVDMTGLRPGGRYRVSIKGGSRWGAEGERIESLPSDVFLLKAPGRADGWPARPTNVGAQPTGPDSVRLTWRDNSLVETGYEIWYRKWSGEQPDPVWRRYGEPLPARTRSAEITGLAAKEEIEITLGYQEDVWVPGETAKRGRYSFVVVAYNDKGFGASEMFDFEFMPGPYPEAAASGEVSDCSSRRTGINLDGYQVHACVEAPDGSRRRAWDYRLDADQSGLLYFFDRDNVEILVKVLDGCAINGHRWVFVAPVTTLAFRLQIRELGPYIANRRQVWHYDSERRPQDRIAAYPLYRNVGNPKDRTARTVSDTSAFPCTAAEIAAAKAASSGPGDDAGLRSRGANPLPRVSAAAATPLAAGARADCEPGGPALTLRGGYTVSMCYETYKGEIGDARDWGLDSSQSGLLYFFKPNNVEVLIKVLDGCGVNGHRWVFVAPVTDLAFNLRVESPDGEEVWTHTNRLGQTADAKSNVSAFPCTA